MMKKLLMICVLLAMSLMKSAAAVDPNFYIYLCFGQSNMEGNATPEAVDKNNVDPRFQTLACVDFQNPTRTQGQWYTAEPPIVRQWAGLGVTDYFGRTMVAALPADVKVGVVNVAIGGVAIEGFMTDEMDSYLSTAEQYIKNAFALYDNNPYQRLVDMGKIAQQSGVIKGILLHQGESNNGQTEWLQKVKTIYERLLKDLDLKAEDVPLFAGETVNADQGGVCSYHNTVIAKLPEVIPTAHVVSSVGCPCVETPENYRVHFTAAGYRTLGKRYAYEALLTMGIEPKAQADYAWDADLKKVYELESLEPIEDLQFRVGGSKLLTVWGTFADGHRENLTAEAQFASDDFELEGNKVKATAEKEGTVTVTCTDFLGQEKTLTVNVTASDEGPNHILAANNGTAGSNAWDKEVFCKLAVTMEAGKTYVVRVRMKADQSGGCSLWPRWDASTNRDQWGNSADIQYEATHAITNDWQEVKWQFKANYPHDVLLFAVGQIGGNVYFDDVSCMEQGGTTEMIANGTFESDDISDWSVLTWTGQSLSVQEEIAAGINAITIPTATANRYYDLRGRIVEHPTKGLYITNGQKILVK